MENSALEKIHCLIIGSGPAGYTAAIYASRAGLNPVLYQGIQPGGQLTITTEVENYPGYPDGIQGPEMMVNFENQAKRMGTDVRYGLATKVDFSSHPYKVQIDEEKWIEADAVIIATGAAPTRSSPFAKSRPIAGTTPNCRKKFELTNCASICSASPRPVRMNEVPRCTAMEENV